MVKVYAHLRYLCYTLDRALGRTR
uniref:Uncharacterized protein n=1 Tax=Anguilla anguilla TaxID=7936 RepID=A0A0E9TVT8_ANGAN